MFFAKSPIIGTVDHHHFFEMPFVCGVSLQPTTDGLVDKWNRRVGCESMTADEAGDFFKRLIDDATVEVNDFAVDLARRIAELKPLVADAGRIADCPVDPAGDRVVIAAYITKADALASEQPLDSDAQRAAATLARWLDRAQGLDRPRIDAALTRHEKAAAAVEKARDAARKAVADLRAALIRLDDPATAARLAGIKLQRDLNRIVPDLIAEFADAQASAQAALGRMADAAGRLKALAP